MADRPNYTPEQANELLPWLARRLRELRDAAGEMRTAQNSVQALTRHARGNGQHDVGGALSDAEQQAARLARRLRDLLDAITGQGIQVRDIDTGLVDFPGIRDGAPIWLCWRTGETAVGHWHEYDQGYSARKPL